MTTGESSGATWIAPAGQTFSWFDPLAWTPSVPTTFETTYVTNGGAPAVNYGLATSSTLYLGSSFRQSGGLIVGGGIVSISTTAYVGNAGYGWVQQTGGSVSVGSLEFGSASGASGSYSLSDGILEVGSSEYLARGNNAAAQFTQSGGIHAASYSTSTLYVAYGSGSVASYAMTDGQVGTYALQVGYGSNASGSFTQSGGQAATSTLTLGYSFGAAGSYGLSGNGILAANAEYVGYGATGVFNQSGGTNRVGTAGQTALYVGHQNGGQGTYNLSGNGQLLASGAEYVGYGISATGVINQTGGVNALGTASLYVGANQPGATGLYQLGGPGVLTAGTEYIGYSGTGSFTGSGAFLQSGGSNTADVINVGVNGRYDLTGGSVQARASFTTTGKVVVGDLANPAAGPSLTTQALYVGGTSFGGTASGSLTLASAGSVDVTQTLRVWSAGNLTIKSGTLTTLALVNDGLAAVTGGALTFAGSSVGASQSSTGSITGGGSLAIGSGVAVRVGSVRQGSLTLDGSLRLRHSLQTSTFNDLFISPGGSLVLADDLAAWNYTGASPGGVLRQYLQSGQHGGDWAGTGVSSSAAAGDVIRVLGIGYAEAADLGVTAWGGANVDSTTLVIKVVPYGDADLDGTITQNDYALLDRGIAFGYSGWSQGDFNYDGVVDQADALILDRTFTIQQGGTPSPALLAERLAQFGDAYVAGLIAAVPEPASAGVAVGSAGTALLRRRRGGRLP